jgi:hypothetical protein
MISRYTSCVLLFPHCCTVIWGSSRLVAGAPRLVTGAAKPVPGAAVPVAGAPRCPEDCPQRSQTCRLWFQVHPKFSLTLRDAPKPITVTPMVLLYQPSEIPITLKAGRNALLGSDTLLKLMHLSLHSTSSRILLEASRDKNTFCWWSNCDLWWLEQEYEGSVCERLGNTSKCWTELWEHLGASGSAADELERVEDNPESTWKHRQQAWKHLELQ